MKPPKSRGSGLSFEAVYRRIADKAAKRAEEAKERAVATESSDPPIDHRVEQPFSKHTHGLRIMRKFIR